MSALVKRLRSRANNEYTVKGKLLKDGQLMLDAANELERLRGLLEFILQDDPNLVPRASSETRAFIRDQLSVVV